MKILAIDPGNIQSAFVLLNEDLSVVDKGMLENDKVIEKIYEIFDRWSKDNIHFAIEMIASYGMGVGKTVFDTCVWIGRFVQIVSDVSLDYGYEPIIQYIYRKDEKINICGTMKAKDSNIRLALIDRFGEVGVKKTPGWFYGFARDLWAAYAVAVTYNDMYLKGNK